MKNQIQARANVTSNITKITAGIHALIEKKKARLAKSRAKAKAQAKNKAEVTTQSKIKAKARAQLRSKSKAKEEGNEMCIKFDQEFLDSDQNNSGELDEAEFNHFLTKIGDIEIPSITVPTFDECLKAKGAEKKGSEDQNEFVDMNEAYDCFNIKQFCGIPNQFVLADLSIKRLQQALGIINEKVYEYKNEYLKQQDQAANVNRDLEVARREYDAAEQEKIVKQYLMNIYVNMVTDQIQYNQSVADHLEKMDTAPENYSGELPLVPAHNRVEKHDVETVEKSVVHSSLDTNEANKTETAKEAMPGMGGLSLGKPAETAEKHVAAAMPGMGGLSLGNTIEAETAEKHVAAAMPGMGGLSLGKPAETAEKHVAAAMPGMGGLSRGNTIEAETAEKHVAAAMPGMGGLSRGNTIEAETAEKHVAAAMPGTGVPTI